MFDCKNWGSGICKPEVNRYYIQESKEPGDEFVEWPLPEKQKNLDEICEKCENRLFKVKDKKCPICGGERFNQEPKRFHYKCENCKVLIYSLEKIL